jgi:hypothetical protein
VPRKYTPQSVFNLSFIRSFSVTVKQLLGKTRIPLHAISYCDKRDRADSPSVSFRTPGRSVAVAKERTLSPLALLLLLADTWHSPSFCHKQTGTCWMQRFHIAHHGQYYFSECDAMKSGRSRPLLAYCWFLVSFTLRRLRRRQYLPPKRQHHIPKIKLSLCVNN